MTRKTSYNSCITYRTSNEAIQYSRPLGRAKGRRRGYVATLVALSWLVLCGFAALSIDLSRMYTRKAEAQKAADAAALAGAYGEALTPGGGRAQAERYARENGYDVTKGAVVQAGPDDVEAGLYRVTLWRPEQLYFAGVLFAGKTKMNVYATAAAEYTQKADIPVQNYGKSDGPISLSVFGPNGYKYNGDPYSVKYITAGAAADGIPDNPDYKGGGYNFNVNPAGGVANYIAAHKDPLTGKAVMQIEIFDPGTGNAGGQPGADQGVAVDEMRDGWKGPKTTTTRYKLTYDNGTIDTSDDYVVTKEYGDDSTDGTDMNWAKAFDIDLADTTKIKNPNGKFILNVEAIDGSSENGFNLRAGPQYSGTISEADWRAQYGNTVSMTGKGGLPLNFNKDGQVIIDFGNVPPLPKGGDLKVRKFDVDILADGTTYNRVDYTDGNISKTGSTMVGGDANDKWQSDTITVPKDYAGGHWFGTYNAGSNDTSAWEMTYPGPGNIRLVR